MADIDNPNFWTDSYNRFREMYLKTEESLPIQNPNIPGKRYLDCAFFDYLVTVVEQDIEPESIGLIRSAFVEGNRIFPDSAICDRTHVQISVINLDLIEHSCIYEG
jgi:hypothetical protein